MWIYDFAFCCKFGKMSQIHVFRGVRPVYYDITWGGVFPIYYNITMGGGVSRDPKFVLRNIWTAPKSRVQVQPQSNYNVVHQQWKDTL